MTDTAELPTIAYRKHTCGFCTAGLHHLCKVATWNPGSGPVAIPGSGSQATVYEGEALYCPCTADECEGKRPVCAQCGFDPGWVEALGPGLICKDGAECALRVAARLENDPIHQLIVECQTTRLVAGELVERPRRATPAERAANQAKREQAKARPCTCGCEGTTKGGAFLPGHDARFVSYLVNAVQTDVAPIDGARVALAPFPALLAKFEKRIA